MTFRILGTSHTASKSRASIAPALVSRITGIEGADVEIAFLKAPGHTLERIEYRKPAAKARVNARPCDTGFAHVTFNVDNVAAAASSTCAIGTASPSNS